MTSADFREPGTDATNETNETQTDTTDTTGEDNAAPMSDAERDATGEDDN